MKFDKTRGGDQRSEEPVRFLDLPNELQIYTASFALWPALTALRLTCKHFGELFDQNFLVTQHAICLTAVHDDEILLVQAGKEHKSHEGLEARYRIYDRRQNLQPYQFHLRLETLPEHSTHTQYLVTTFDDPGFALLPCYTCLRWLPSRPEANLLPSLNNHFSRSSRMQVRRTGPQSPSEIVYRLRICIPCGIRTGFYRPGTRVAQCLICLLCRKLEHRPAWPGPRKDPGYWNFDVITGFQPPKTITGYWYGQPGSLDRKAELYCAACQLIPEVASMSHKELDHVLCKYENGMRRGKAQRDARGREIRRQLGITQSKPISSPVTGPSSELERTQSQDPIQGSPALITEDFAHLALAKADLTTAEAGLLPTKSLKFGHYCPVMAEDNRLCRCLFDVWTVNRRYCTDTKATGPCHPPQSLQMQHPPLI